MPYYKKQKDNCKSKSQYMDKKKGHSLSMTAWITLFGIVMILTALLSPQYDANDSSSQPFALNLSEKTQEALNHGVTLHIHCELAKKKNITNLYLGKTLIVGKFKLIRHSLSNQYIVKKNNSETPYIFHSIREATSFIASQSIHALKQYKKTNKKHKIRFKLNKYKLPSPLRLHAFISPSWGVNNDWVTWSNN